MHKLYLFDVCYLNNAKQVVLVTINATDRTAAHKAVADKPDCRKYHHVPSITSITQHSAAPH
jgi:hypothetical protein